jgi:hypothetical protein
METADVRKRIIDTIARAKREAGDRRRRNADAEAAFARFLEEIATPIFRQVAGVLKAEGFGFLVNTPAGAVQLASDRSSVDGITLSLDTTGAVPQVQVSVRRSRGRETFASDHPLRPGVLVEHLTDQDVLDVLADVLGPFVEK